MQGRPASPSTTATPPARPPAPSTPAPRGLVSVGGRRAIKDVTPARGLVSVGGRRSCLADATPASLLTPEREEAVAWGLSAGASAAEAAGGEARSLKGNLVLSTPAAPLAPAVGSRLSPWHGPFPEGLRPLRPPLVTVPGAWGSLLPGPCPAPLPWESCCLSSLEVRPGGLQLPASHRAPHTDTAALATGGRALCGPAGGCEHHRLRVGARGHCTPHLATWGAQRCGGRCTPRAQRGCSSQGALPGPRGLRTSPTGTAGGEGDRPRFGLQPRVGQSHP